MLPAIVDRVVDFASEKGIPRRKLETVVGPRNEAAIRGETAHAILAYVVGELGDPATVWDFASRARPGDYGPYGFVLQASDTVGDALLRAARFFATTATTAEMAIATGARTAKIVVRRRDGANSAGAELGTQYIVAQVVRLLAAISGDKVRPRAIHFAARPPHDPSALERAMGLVPQFAAPATSVEIDRSALDLPLPRRDPDLIRHFERGLRQSETQSVGSATRHAMEQAIVLGSSTAAEDIARSLGLGTRTLRRQLAAEGTTLRELFDQVRRERATERLRQSRVSLAGLAFELGFSDQTALSRAFRRWTGQSPAEFHRAAR